MFESTCHQVRYKMDQGASRPSHQTHMHMSAADARAVDDAGYSKSKQPYRKKRHPFVFHRYVTHRLLFTSFFCYSSLLIALLMLLDCFDQIVRCITALPTIFLLSLFQQYSKQPRCITKAELALPLLHSTAILNSMTCVPLDSTSLRGRSRRASELHMKRTTHSRMSRDTAPSVHATLRWHPEEGSKGREDDC